MNHVIFYTLTGSQLRKEDHQRSGRRGQAGHNQGDHCEIDRN
jgi:hypothetical protein